jgi:hypothetical protein
LAAALISSGAHAATTCDAFTSFNGTQAAGNFSWLSSAPNGVTPLSSESCVINNTICLGLPGAPNGLPGVFKSTGTASTTHTYMPLDRLLIHPGISSSLLGAFVAPTAGEYSYSIQLDGLTAGTSANTFALVVRNGQSTTLGTGFLLGLGSTAVFNGTQTLAAGESILIGLGNAGNYSSDSTGLRFTVTQLGGNGVPEPAAWAMMIAGFGLVGGAMRRRTTTTVTYA